MICSGRACFETSDARGNVLNLILPRKRAFWSGRFGGSRNASSNCARMSITCGSVLRNGRHGGKERGGEGEGGEKEGEGRGAGTSRAGGEEREAPEEGRKEERMWWRL